jgi:Protein of unknown function (DUF2505)
MRFEWVSSDSLGEVRIDQLVQIWADPSFYVDYAKELKLDSHNVVIEEGADQLLTTQQLAFSTRGVPSVFRGLLGVGDAMTVSWTTRLAYDGASGQMTASTEDGRLTFTASTSVTSEAEKVRWTVEGPVRLKAPWPIRGTAESQLAKLLQEVLEDQATVTDRWLGRRTAQTGTGVDDA